MAEFVPDAEGYFSIGPHRFRFEPPDVIHVWLDDSDVKPEEYDAFYATATRLVPDRPVYVLRDGRQGGDISAKSRARIIEISNPQRLAAVVSYGASFRRRIIVSMLMRALRTFKNAAPDAAFFDTESEARAFIAMHRTRPQ